MSVSVVDNNRTSVIYPVLHGNNTNAKKDAWLDSLYTESMKMATSVPYRPNTRVRRDGGYGCKKSGLGIFNFLLFLVVLLGLLNSLLSSAMTMIMINGENVSLLQVYFDKSNCINSGVT